MVGVGPLNNFFGFAHDDWKPWTTFDGTPVLVPGGFTTEPASGATCSCTRRATARCRRVRACRRRLLLRRDLRRSHRRGAPRSRGQRRGVHADHRRRSRPRKREAERLSPTGKAVMFVVGDTGFGDIAFVPGLTLKHPRGIRDVEQWYMSLSLRPEYVYEVFERQCEVGLRNLEAVHAVAGDAISVVYVSGTDFGAQDRPFISPSSTATSSSRSTCASTSGSTRTPSGRASSTRTDPSGVCSTTSSTRASTSSTPCRRRRRTWIPPR